MVTQRESGHRPRGGVGRQLANGLGWFSIGLGVAELVAPRAMEKVIGVRDRDRRRNVLRAYGMREIAAGVGILSMPSRPEWLWTRVAGDIVDLASLGQAFALRDAKRGRVAAATAAVLGVTALDVLCGTQLSRRKPFRASATVLIGKKPEELYPFWRDLSNVVQLEPYLESVRPLADDRWRWTARIGGGPALEVDTEIVRDQPNQYIEWRSPEGSATRLRAAIRFTPAAGDRGTLERSEVEIDGPLALLAKPASAAGIGPELRLEQHLRRFKQLMETGEIARAYRGQATQPRPRFETTRGLEPAL